MFAFTLSICNSPYACLILTLLTSFDSALLSVRKWRLWNDESCGVSDLVSPVIVNCQLSIATWLGWNELFDWLKFSWFSCFSYTRTNGIQWRIRIFDDADTVRDKSREILIDYATIAHHVPRQLKDDSVVILTATGLEDKEPIRLMHRGGSEGRLVEYFLETRSIARNMLQLMERRMYKCNGVLIHRQGWKTKEGEKLDDVSLSNDFLTDTAVGCW